VRAEAAPLLKLISAQPTVECIGAKFFCGHLAHRPVILAQIGPGKVQAAAVAQHLKLGDFHFLLRHIIWLIPALGLIIGISMLERRWIWRLGSVLMAGALIGMVAVLWSGMEIKGAQRWLHVFGFSVQPSEFAKPAFAIVAAWLMAQQKEHLNFPGNMLTGALYLVTISLLLLQPDMGMTIIITAIWAAQITLAGFPFRLLLGLGGAAMGGMVVSYFTLPHVRSRIDRFLDPDSGDTFQVQKSLEAFQSGGVIGQGPGQGSVKLDLPDAHADFIFAVAGEEMGLIFVLIVIALFGFIVLRGFNRLMESEDMFSVLAAGGLLTMLGLQALVHMGSAMNVLPAKGMTLPFISYGGSSILAVSLAMGAVLALTKRRRSGGIARGAVSAYKSV